MGGVDREGVEREDGERDGRSLDRVYSDVLLGSQSSNWEVDREEGVDREGLGRLSWSSKFWMRDRENGERESFISINWEREKDVSIKTDVDGRERESLVERNGSKDVSSLVDVEREGEVEETVERWERESEWDREEDVERGLDR
jgi:hypothetical protein